MKVRVIATLVTALCLAFGSASASSIGVFFTNDASDCDFNNAPNAPITWYIIAILGGDGAANGITGAEFSEPGIPAGWFVSPSPNPAANVNLIHANGIGTGANIAFPSCQTGSMVLLYTLSGFATSNPSTRIVIDRHTFPSNPNFSCPVLVLCDAPTFTTICVPGGQGILNGVPCTVGVEQQSWSGVKELFN
jgi:hypothetical protein